MKFKSTVAGALHPAVEKVPKWNKLTIPEDRRHYARTAGVDPTERQGGSFRTTTGVRSRRAAVRPERQGVSRNLTRPAKRRRPCPAAAPLEGHVFLCSGAAVARQMKSPASRRGSFLKIGRLLVDRDQSRSCSRMMTLRSGSSCSFLMMVVCSRASGSCLMTVVRS